MKEFEFIKQQNHIDGRFLAEKGTNQPVKFKWICLRHNIHDPEAPIYVYNIDYFRFPKFCKHPNGEFIEDDYVETDCTRGFHRQHIHSDKAYELLKPHLVGVLCNKSGRARSNLWYKCIKEGCPYYMKKISYNKRKCIYGCLGTMKKYQLVLCNKCGWKHQPQGECKVGQGTVKNIYNLNGAKCFNYQPIICKEQRNYWNSILSPYCLSNVLKIEYHTKPMVTRIKIAEKSEKNQHSAFVPLIKKRSKQDCFCLSNIFGTSK